MGTYVGVDLHSNNAYYGIIDQNDERIFQKKLPNDLPLVLSALEPFRKDVEGIVIESTYNWYWLADGLIEAGYNVRLANPAAIKQYDGLKYSDDIKDSFFLARLLKLGILPEGYIYPKEGRSVRDLLRKRLMLVRQRTSHILSFENHIARNTGSNISSNAVKKMNSEDLELLLDDKHLVLSGEVNIEAIRFLDEQIKKIEKAVLAEAKLKEPYKHLLTVPGIGKILALTIMLETGDIKRFPKVGNYSSYCRCVKSERLSNDKKKGRGNSRNGNKYLSWAYVEAANYMRRWCPEANSFYQKKSAKTNKIVATKALANKTARACYHIIRDQEPFDVKRIFGNRKGCGSEPEVILEKNHIL
jgi:transposase